MKLNQQNFNQSSGMHTQNQIYNLGELKWPFYFKIDNLCKTN